jgi:hypothetical protein
MTSTQLLGCAEDAPNELWLAPRAYQQHEELDGEAKEQILLKWVPFHKMAGFVANDSLWLI